MKSKKLLGNGMLLITAFVWGTAFVFQRVGMESIEPISFNAARMVLAALAVSLVAYLSRKKERANAAVQRTEAEEKRYNKNTLIGGICCGIFLSMASNLQQMGMVYTTAGKAGFITALYMLLVPIFGFVIFKKRNNWLVWLAVLLGIVGMYFLCISEKLQLSRGDLLVGISAVFFCCHILCCDYFVQRGHPISISAIQFATVFVVSAVMALLWEEPTLEKILSAVFPIFFCGLLSGGVGYTLQLIAQRYTDPTTSSLLLSMESLFAVLAGVVLLQEHLSSRELIGCFIMFAALILVQIPLPGEKEAKQSINKPD